jgi:hypothetical protein
LIVGVDAARARLRELSDFAAPWAVWVAATLRLADHIEAGVSRLDELADSTRTNRDSLRRLMRYLVARGLFIEANGAYTNTDLSRLLLDERGWRQWLDLDNAPGIWAESWIRLLESVRTGSPDRDYLWYEDELRRTGRAASFDELMAVQARANAQEIAAIHDWSQAEHVVDIGGGTGVMLRTLLAAHPHLRGTLFDLSRVVNAAERAERLDCVAGDFFADPLPHADTYVLSQILHGCTDDNAARILTRCVEAGAAQMRILIVEELIPADPTADQASFDLFMLTLGGGQQRTLEEFRLLAQSVGLAVWSSQLLTSGYSIVELGASS